MSTALELFTYEDQQVRTVVIDGEPWFVAADVTTVLGYSEASAMTRTLDADEKGLQIVHTPGGDQQLSVVSEAGLYSAIVRSRVPAAKAFKRWVTHEVLPSIRRTGQYGTPAVNMLDAVENMTTTQWVNLAAGLAARAEHAEAKVEQLAPAADAWQQFMDADGTYTLNAVAKIVGVGRTALMSRMRTDRILTVDNLPMQQQHVNASRFVVKVGAPWTKPDGTTHVSRFTRVTATGAAWLADRYAPVGQVLAPTR